jgi:hypothetical protein
MTGPKSTSTGDSDCVSAERNFGSAFDGTTTSSFRGPADGDPD